MTKKPVEKKVCLGCGDIKPLTNLYRDNSTKDGFDFVCKSCRDGWGWGRASKEYINEQQKKLDEAQARRDTKDTKSTGNRNRRPERA